MLVCFTIVPFSSRSAWPSATFKRLFYIIEAKARVLASQDRPERCFTNLEPPFFLSPFLILSLFFYLINFLVSSFFCICKKLQKTFYCDKFSKTLWVSVLEVAMQIPLTFHAQDYKKIWNPNCYIKNCINKLIFSKSQFPT